ncbi:conserved hypothetical protein [Desulfatibacillum aliphaticivorans]|uniref:Transposase IS200-like domain-containing protein n=1 Tax=Desulfatibacillum aliphaticivorans TaxID=218208 RepID=B8FNF1_DESAL|nr:transposase [Desulfatibacillum aliphaticivorans]ACL06120.1 conserved hypothetical protein [Desulfatibacillum aliphaticivorans]
MKYYDYSSAGAYFVTICTHNRELLFGHINEGELFLNEYGFLVEKRLLQIPDHFPGALIDEYVIMPNHFHGIIILEGESSRNQRRTIEGPDQDASSQSRRLKPKLGDIIAYLKYLTTKDINAIRDAPGQKVWQPDYYDHVIRNERALNRIRMYIRANPKQWNSDPENPEAINRPSSTLNDPPWHR